SGHHAYRRVTSCAHSCSNVLMDGHRYDGPTARKIRQHAGVRMIALARAADVSYGHLRMFEAGTRNISPEVAHRLARALTDLGTETVTADAFTRPFRPGAVEDAA